MTAVRAHRTIRRSTGARSDTIILAHGLRYPAEKAEKNNVVEPMGDVMRTVSRLLPVLLAVFLFVGTVAAQDTADTTATEAGADVPVVLDDDELTEAVRSRLGSLDGFDAVSVEVEAGVVRLSGTVSSVHAWRQAEELAVTIGGVAEVRNDLEIETNVMEQGSELQETVSRAGHFVPGIGFALLVLLPFVPPAS